jgi:hypothetical protein
MEVRQEETKIFCMKYLVKIKDVKSTDKLEGAWSNDDFKELLVKFEFPDADQVKTAELKEYLFMAISDFEPYEAAAILLDYKLSENNLLNRLLGDQLEGREPFPEAEGIVWDLQNKGNNTYSMTISEKWLTKNEFTKPEYECTVQPFEEQDEER